MQILQKITFKTERQNAGNPIKAVKTGFLGGGDIMVETGLLGKLDGVREV